MFGKKNKKLQCPAVSGNKKLNNRRFTSSVRTMGPRQTNTCGNN